MFTPLHNLLQQLAERSVTLVAGLFATALERLVARCDAEQQAHLESLAQEYEESGHLDVAQSLREQARVIRLTEPAQRGDELLRRLGQRPESAEPAQRLSTEIATSTPTEESLKKTARLRRTRSSTVISEPTEAPATLDGSAFFALQSPADRPSTTSQEEQA